MMNRALLLTALLLSGCATFPHRMVAPRTSAEAETAIPGQSELYLGVVDGLIKQQRYQAAIAFLAKYQKTGAPTPRFRILAGAALAGAGRGDEAIASYRGALQSSSAALAYNGIGKAEAARGNWGEAAENFRHASGLDPANPDYLNNLGYALLQRDGTGAELGVTVEVLQRAHELAPEQARVTANLAVAMNRAGRRAQFLTLLDTIPDAQGRRLVADLAANWQPGNTGSPKGYTP